MNWSEVPVWVYDVAKIMIGGVFGFAAKVLADRRKATSQQRELIRGLVACTEPLTRSLHRVSVQLVNLDPGAEPALAFFTVESQIVAPSDLSEFSDRVRSNTKLQQLHLRRLRDAEECVHRADRLFHNLRGQSVLPGRAGIVASQLTALRSAALEAQTKLAASLKEMRPVAARDTRELIDRLLREVA